MDPGDTVFTVILNGFNSKDNGTSYYKKRLNDADAMYFDPGKTDGSIDVSDTLQNAINQFKITHNFGVLFDLRFVGGRLHGNR